MMNNPRTTNWLLAGVLVLLGVQLGMQLERSAQAETFWTDSCITERISGTPGRYLHVVAHPASSHP